MKRSKNLLIDTIYDVDSDNWYAEVYDTDLNEGDVAYTTKWHDAEQDATRDARNWVDQNAN